MSNKKRPTTKNGADNTTSGKDAANNVTTNNVGKDAGNAITETNDKVSALEKVVEELRSAVAELKVDVARVMISPKKTSTIEKGKKEKKEPGMYVGRNFFTYQQIRSDKELLEKLTEKGINIPE